jgi:FkbM family methyltransferase
MLNIKLWTKIKILFLFFFYLFQNKKKIASFFIFVIKNYKISHSQIFQDLFVYFFSNKKRNGFFLEIGAADGINISNTYLLEKKFNWNGILCEPNPIHKTKILKNRRSILNTNIIDSKTSIKKIFYIHYNNFNSSLNKIKKFHNKISLKTISLNSLLKKYQCPKIIDYISIDTEGNEFNILKNYNFKKYMVKIFSIEHNFDTSNRKKIFKLMEKNNYKRILKSISFMDDWYIHEDFI